MAFIYESKKVSNYRPLGEAQQSNHRIRTEMDLMWHCRRNNIKKSETIDSCILVCDKVSISNQWRKDRIFDKWC